MRRQSRSKTFYGSSLSSRDFGQFAVTERQYPGGYLTPVHAHERAIFCLVLDGAYEEQHCHRILQCTPTTTLFHAAHQEHLERFAECGARSLIVELQPEWIRRLREVAPLAFHETRVHDGGMLRPIGAKLYREFLSDDAASDVVIEGVLLEMAGEFFRAGMRGESNQPAWIGRAVELIREHFPMRLTLSHIADQAGVHPVHLAQTFRKFQGCTVGDYIRRVRIDYACEQLIRSETPLIDLAIEAGFADQSHFGRTFKRVVGVSPSEYRVNARRL